MLKDMILIDIETQDFNVESGIYEVACLVIQDYEIIDQLYLGQEIEDWDGERIYGYGFYDISNDGSSVDRFKTFIEKYNLPLIAHNCPFDRKFLVYYEWIPEDYPCYCSMRAIRYSIERLESYSLANLVRHFSICDAVTHKAFDDIMNVHEILKIVKPDTWIMVGKSKSKTKKDNNALDVSVYGINRTNTLLNEVVCFTGASQYTRVEMQAIAKANGAEISDNVTNKTTMLVVGIDAGSKLAKAQEKDIVIISDEDFMKRLNMTNTEVAFERQDLSSGQILVTTTNKLTPKQKDIEMRKSRFLPQSVYDDRKKKWYEYEPEFWSDYQGELDENGVEWKPLNVIERFSDAEGYYVSRDYDLKRPNGKIVPMQTSIKGKAFYPEHYAMLFMVNEYNTYITKYKYIYIYSLDNDRILDNYHDVFKYRFCAFVLSQYDLRPQTLDETIDLEVERRFEKKHGFRITLYLTDEARHEDLRKEEFEKEEIRKALIEELRKKKVL